MMKIYDSPNKSLRKSPRIDMIVIHATAGNYKSALEWMMNAKSQVSAHYLIGKDGTIAQLVKESLKAWHAGKSQWGTDTDINSISIGIELENANDGKDPYPDEQIQMLAKLCHNIMSFFKDITYERIVGHDQIAPGRKTDPNINFPWIKFGAYLREEKD